MLILKNNELNLFEDIFEIKKLQKYGMVNFLLAFLKNVFYNFKFIKTQQINNQNILEIKKPVRFECDYGFAELSPNESLGEGLNIYLQSSFDGKYEDQDITIQNLNGNYIESISKARTFGFYHEIEYLKSQNE